MQLALLTCHFKAMTVCNILHTKEVAGVCQGAYVRLYAFPTNFCNFNLHLKFPVTAMLTKVHLRVQFNFSARSFLHVFVL